MFTLDEIKIWPQVVLATFNYSGGAVRAWFLARKLDTEGSGWILLPELIEYSKYLGINPKTYARWLSKAVSIGLFLENKEKLSITSLEKGALKLNCDHIGIPAIISATSFVRKGWKDNVWSAYLATLLNRPISQRKKYELTGISPRRQRYYQSSMPGSKIYNFVELGIGTELDAKGIRDALGIHVFSRNGRLIQRLPDTRKVPMEVARVWNRGRSRKAQKEVNLSLSLEREKGNDLRLFHENHKDFKRTQRKWSKSNIPIWKQPEELFELSESEKTYNLWKLKNLEDES